MTNAPVKVATLLEIRREPDGNIPAALISAAYRASLRKPVMLVLDAVSTAEVDRLLDPVVAGSGREHRGVVYARLGDDGVVLESAANAARVFASSENLRAKLASRGITFRDVSEAELALGNGEREPG